MEIKITLTLLLISVGLNTAQVQLYYQCGGQGYTGDLNCESGLACFKKDKYYAQCLPRCPSDWDCNSQLAGLNEQCSGVDYCGLSNCFGGLTCLRKNESFSACQSSCPNEWDCNKPLVNEYGQCGGLGYEGLTNCSGGLNCYEKDKYFSQCLSSCPLGWNCVQCDTNKTQEIKVASKLDTQTMKIETSTIQTSPEPITIFGQCGGTGYDGYNVCVLGLTCFKKNKYYAQCLPRCPSDWDCNSQLAGLNEQCGGVDYCGLSNCFGGLTCLRKNESFSACQSSCPNEWDCNKPLVNEYGQCGGLGYEGLTNCSGGLNCYEKDKYFSQCLSSCPLGWNCVQCEQKTISTSVKVSSTPIFQISTESPITSNAAVLSSKISKLWIKRN